MDPNNRSATKSALTYMVLQGDIDNTAGPSDRPRPAVRRAGRYTVEPATAHSPASHRTCSVCQGSTSIRRPGQYDSLARLCVPLQAGHDLLSLPDLQHRLIRACRMSAPGLSQRRDRGPLRRVPAQDHDRPLVVSDVSLDHEPASRVLRDPHGLGCSALAGLRGPIFVERTNSGETPPIPTRHDIVELLLDAPAARG